MENKYYIPEIEEFRVGFEYESFIVTEIAADKIPKREWLTEVYTGKQFEKDGISTAFKLRKHPVTGENWTRVKYLDKDDIESLGFICNYTDQYFKGDDTILVDDDFFMQIIRRKEDSVDEAYLFQGTIKNKSELKVLLKQLNIN